MSSVIAVMPTWQHNDFIEAAMNTVIPEVDRLIVVDDGSEPPCPQAEIRISPNGGTAGAINLGIERARLDAPTWLTWVSADNTYPAGWMKKLLGAADEETGVVYGGFTWKRPGHPGVYMFTPYDPKRLIADRNCFFGPAFIIRREVWQEAGPHRGKISHDYDHWLRVEEACWKMGLGIVGVNESLCNYNAHDRRATVLRAVEYDAHLWQVEARKRRGVA